MKKITAIFSLLVLAPAAWAQAQTTTTTKPETKPETKAVIPEHGTATATAGTKSTAITSPAVLERYGQASGEEAKQLLAQYHEQETALFQLRRAAYVQMQGKSDDEKRKIWSAMLEAQKKPRAEHLALEKRLTAARKDEAEKAAAAEVAARAIKNGATGQR
jgi:hypothetical protein